MRWWQLIFKTHFKAKEVDHETLMAVLRGPIVRIPVRMYGGRPLSADADPSALIERLKTNRTRLGTGSGTAYWESVVRIVEDHYGIK